MNLDKKVQLKSWILEVDEKLDEINNQIVALKDEIHKVNFRAKCLREMSGQLKGFNELHYIKLQDGYSSKLNECLVQKNDFEKLRVRLLEELENIKALEVTKKGNNENRTN